MNNVSIKIDRLLEENDSQIIQQYIKKHKLETINDPTDTYPFLDRKYNIESVIEILKFRLKDKGKKLTPEMKKNFLKRFTPFYQDGTGEGLLFDKKTKKIITITHEADLFGMIEGLSAEDWFKDVGLDKLGLEIPKNKPGWIKRNFG